MRLPHPGPLLEPVRPRAALTLPLNPSFLSQGASENKEGENCPDSDSESSWGTGCGKPIVSCHLRHLEAVLPELTFPEFLSSKFISCFDELSPINMQRGS